MPLIVFSDHNGIEGTVYEDATDPIAIGNSSPSV